MKQTTGQKLFSAALILYWLGIFVATHIPVPYWTRRMGLSDKAMHFAAYMLLAFLMWFALKFPQKCNWKKPAPYLVYLAILIYGCADEIFQTFARRSADAKDLIANLLGAAAAMAAMTFMKGQNAVMLPLSICPVFLPSLVLCRLIKPASLLEIIAYGAVFAAVYIGWLARTKSILLTIPICLILAGGLKWYSSWQNKPFGKNAVIASIGAIAIMTAAAAVGKIIKTKRQPKEALV